MISKIKKRDSSIVTFDQNKITEAIWHAAKSVGGEDHALAEKISNQVCSVLEVFFKDPGRVPTVEQIQDLVEKILIENGHAKTAKAYILYREEHNRLRQEKSKILGSSDSIILTFPKNATLEQVKELIEIAEKVGCTYLTATQEPKRQVSPQQNSTSLPKNLSEDESEEDESDNDFEETSAAREYQISLPFQERKNSLNDGIARKSVEEVIPPPIESLTTSNI